MTTRKTKPFRFGGPTARMHFLYAGDHGEDLACRGVLLSRPWRLFSPGMKRTCRTAIKRLFRDASIRNLFDSKKTIEASMGYDLHGRR